MLVQMMNSLVKLYDNLSEQDLILPTSLILSNKIDYRIDLSDDGSFIFLKNLEEFSGKSKKLKSIKIPNIKLGKSSYSFLYGNNDYIFGANKSAKKFFETRDFTLNLLKDINIPAVDALKSFYGNLSEKIGNIQIKEGKNLSELIYQLLLNNYSEFKKINQGKDLDKIKYSFSYKGKLLIEYKEIFEAWDNYFMDDSNRNDLLDNQLCLLSGNFVKAPRTYLKVGGSNLFSLNTSDSDSYLAYYDYKDNIGAWYAPIDYKLCNKIESAFSYIENQQKNSFKLPDSSISILAWTSKSESIGEQINYLRFESSLTIEEIYKKFGKGEIIDIEGISFNSSDDIWIVEIEIPTNGRKAIKNIWHNTLGIYIFNMYNQLKKFRFSYRFNGNTEVYTPRYLKDIYSVISQDDSKKKNYSLISQFYYSLLNDKNFPEEFLFQIVRRYFLLVKSTNKLTNLNDWIFLKSLSIIKAYLIKNYEIDIEEDLSMTNQSNAYIFGKYFRLCLQAQILVNNEEPNSSLRNRFFNQVFTEPGLVFVELSKSFQISLKSLVGSDIPLKRGCAKKYEQLAMNYLSEIDSRLFEKSFSVKDSCEFILGFNYVNDIFSKSFEESA